MGTHRVYKLSDSSQSIFETSPLGCTSDYASLVQQFQQLRLSWTDNDDDDNNVDRQPFTSTTSLLKLEIKESKKRIKGQAMACMDALCRRLKRIFSGGATTAVAAAPTATDVKVKKQKQQQADSIGNEQKILTVNINRFASPIDEITSERKIVNKRKKKKKQKKKKKDDSTSVRKILRFNTTKSCSNETISHSLSVSISLDTFNSTTSRYEREFKELGLVGSGAFGSVYRCINRLDGCVYAVKRSKPVARSCYAQRRAINEVHANAALNGPNEHVVRYYSAWIELDCMSIQQEYCNGGDLAEVIDDMRMEERWFEESALRRLLYHVADGLKYIHGFKLAHMDIKPENIFISKKRIVRAITSSEDSNNSAEGDYTEEVVYKIGDLGHITSTTDTEELEDEGDCRYLSKEILREDYRDLTKADIFALGLTVYEAGSGVPLPKNGPAWHDIRDGKLMRLKRYSVRLNDLMKMMTHPEPAMRPSAADLVREQFLTIDPSINDSVFTNFDMSLSNNGTA